MPNYLILLHAADIGAALTLKAQHPDLEVLVFDPGLVDRAADAGLGTVRCLTWEEAPAYLQRVDEATRQTRVLGAELDAQTEPLWPGLGLGSWQHLSLFYLHMAMGWYSGVAEAVVPRLPEGSLHLPLTDSAQTYYLPSFVPAVLLLQTLQRQGRRFQAFTHSRQAALVQRVPDLRGTRPAGTRGFLLTHLPTCFYDADHINAEIRHSGHEVVDLTARYWHVPVGSQPSLPLVDVALAIETLGDADRARIAAVLDALRLPLQRHLSQWLASASFLQRQVDQLLAVYRAQLVLMALLPTYFALQRPLRLLLSDHDTDFHGPLAAFARAQQVPLLVLPHSKTSTDLDFIARQAQVVYHAIQGEPIYDVDGQRPAQATLALPATLQLQLPLAPVRRIGLLLNSISLNGVCGVDYPAYHAGIARIVAWCEEQGLSLVLRSRAARTLFRPVLQGAGFSAAQLEASVLGDMAEFAQACDLCLMYDAPTSGAVEFLGRGVPLLNPVVSSQSKRETGSMHSTIVPRGELEVLLHQAATLVADPIELQRFRLQQFARYLDGLRQAQPLHCFL
jgi:hypothetical protein